MNFSKIFDGFSWKDWGFIVFVIVSWGANAAAVKVGTNEISPEALIFYRSIITAFLFFPFVKKVTKADLINLSLVSFVFVTVHFLLMYTSLDNINSNSYVVILMLAFPISMIFSSIFLNEKIGKWTYAGMAIAFSGLLFAFGLPDVQAYPFGAILALFAACAWAIGSLLMKKTKAIPLPTFTFYIFFMAIPFLGLFCFVREGTAMFDFNNARLLPLGLSLLYQTTIIAIAAAVWGYLIGHHRAEYVTPFLMLQIPVAALAGYIFLGEAVTQNFVLSSCIIIFGVGLIHYRRLKAVA